MRYFSGCRPTTSKVLTPIDPVDPRRVRVFNRPIITLNDFESLESRLRSPASKLPVCPEAFCGRLDPFGRRGGLLQGSLMRLVSLWWELPPRLDSNSNI